MNIVISGASAGIGFALAKLYAKPGVTLGLIGRDAARLAQIETLCQQQGAHVVLGAVDVTDANILKDWLLHFDQQFPIDLLIANAGVTSVLSSHGDMESWESVTKVLDVNIHGVINTIYPLLEPMRQRQAGQIAIVSSLAAFYGMPISPAYCATKSAVKAYGEALRGYLKAHNVKVSVICPGFVKSAMSDQFLGVKIGMISAEQAAIIIQKGLLNNKARICFPRWLALGMQLLAILPDSVADYFFTNFDYASHSKRK